MKKIAILFILLGLLLPGMAQAAPEKITIGGYINDIQEIDLQSHSYRLDLYVWFRWKDPKIDPSKTAEFMNAFDPADHVRTPLYDSPQKMPDGSLYMIIRDQGKFSTKFSLQSYPFDEQELAVTVEDSLSDIRDLVYVPDDKTPASISTHVNLPGFNVGAPMLRISDAPYLTNFGDLTASANPYSHATFVVPIARPKISTGIKVFLPVMLIILCTAFIFFVHPVYIEGRLGVAITALLTLVALQLTTASTLPNVDYLLLTDKIYILSYFFIIATLLQIVWRSGLVQKSAFEDVIDSDRKSLKILTAIWLAGMLLLLAG